MNELLGITAFVSNEGDVVEIHSMSGEGWHGDLTSPAAPVQIHGQVDGFRFFFYARQDRWDFNVADRGKDPALEYIYGAWAPYGEAHAWEASWMPHARAWEIVQQQIAIFREERS